MRILNMMLVSVTSFFFVSCAHTSFESVPSDQASRLSPKLVRDSVVYEKGAKEGAVIPELSAPRLRAVWIPERVEGSRLIEAHREWLLEGDVSILGTPTLQKAK